MWLSAIARISTVSNSSSFVHITILHVRAIINNHVCARSLFCTNISRKVFQELFIILLLICILFLILVFLIIIM